MGKILNIGRADTNHIVIKNNRVSSKHCCIKQMEDGQFLLEDLNSSNGTFVNGVQILQKVVNTQDKCRLAEHDLDLVLVCSLFKEAQMPQGMSYASLQAQKQTLLEKLKESLTISEEFKKREKTYEDYKQAKRKVRLKFMGKSTGMRAGLALIPLVGNSLGVLAAGSNQKMQDALEDLTEQFKKEYTCPKCYKFLGDEPYENLEKRGYCFYCKTTWK